MGNNGGFSVCQRLARCTHVGRCVQTCLLCFQRAIRPAIATCIVAIRHGETAWNVDACIQGHLDISLNDVGMRQAQRAGAALADEYFDAIYSRDLQRALIAGHQHRVRSVS